MGRVGRGQSINQVKINQTAHTQLPGLVLGGLSDKKIKWVFSGVVATRAHILFTKIRKLFLLYQWQKMWRSDGKCIARAE